MNKCLQCAQQTPNDIFCDVCTPLSCFECGTNLHRHKLQGADVVYACENGHKTTVREYATNHITELYTSEKDKRLRNLGYRTEIIIPNPDTITNITATRNSLVKSDGYVYGIHYTDPNQVETIVSEGLKRPSELSKEQRKRPLRTQADNGRIRYDSVFAWPHTHDASPNDFEESIPVFVEIPVGECVISSYRYLDFVGPNPEQDNTAISIDTYESKFVFDADEFYTMCQETNRPFSPDELLTLC